MIQLQREVVEHNEACEYCSKKLEEAIAQSGPWLAYLRKVREDLGLPNVPLDGSESLSEAINKSMQVARQYPAPISTPVGQMVADAAAASAALDAYLAETQQTMMDFAQIPSRNLGHPNTSDCTSSEHSK